MTKSTLLRVRKGYSSLLQRKMYPGTDGKIVLHGDQKGIRLIEEQFIRQLEIF